VLALIEGARRRS
jgi:hypothetical protein